MKNTSFIYECPNILIYGHDGMGTYKHGKPNQEIEITELSKALKRSVFELAYQAYIILLYWLGCRRSEPLFIRKEDVKEKNGVLYIDIPALKGGERGGSVELPLSLYGVDMIKEVWEQTPAGARVFRFCDKTGYRKVVALLPKKTPHWLRHNRLTKLRRRRDRGEISTDDIKAYTGIKSDSTIEHYGMKTPHGIHKVAQVLD